MITLRSISYQEPSASSAPCTIVIHLDAAPSTTSGRELSAPDAPAPTSLENAIVFGKRLKLLVDTPFSHGDLALDSDGNLLSTHTLRYLIECAEQRGWNNSQMDNAQMESKARRQLKAKRGKQKGAKARKVVRK
jgi:hypothetical protein